MTMDNVTFQTNNLVGNFNYPSTVPAYKPIMKFLLNCPLNKAFTNCSSLVYQNFLNEFWNIAVAYDPFPSTNETKQRPLRELLIKFLVLNGQRPLTLDFNTFCSSTGLDNNNGKYVAHPTPEAVKKELGKIAINQSYLDKTTVLKNLFPLAWRILFTFLIQVLGRNYSSTEQVNSIQHDYDCCTLEPKKGKSQTMTPTLPKSQGPEASKALSKKSKKPKSKKTPAKTKETSTSKPMEGSEQSYSVSSGIVPDPQDLERNIQLASTGLPSTLDEGTRKSQPLLKSTTIDPKDSVGNKQPIDMGLPSTTSDEGTAKTTPLPEGSLGEKTQEGIKHPLIWNQSTLLAFLLSDDEAQESEEDILGAASDTESSYDDILKKYDNTLPLTERQLTTMNDLYTGLKVITELLKDINNAVKDDPAINKKISEATETFTKISLNITESMMNEMYEVFSGQSSSAPSGSVTLTLALIHILANVEWENATNTATEDPPSHTEGETDASKQEKPDEPKHSTDANIEFIGIATDEKVEDQLKLVKASTIVRPDPDALVLVPYMINGKLYHLTAEQIDAHLDNEEKIKKAKEEARLLAMNKPEVIKVVQEEAEKIRLDPKTIKSAKAGENSRKLRMLNIKSSRDNILRKSEYLLNLGSTNMITTCTDGRNFDFHEPFAFGNFGISELDKLREIIPRKKNAVVKDLMNSLSRRYERIRKIPEELGIKSALPAPAPALEQASSRSSRKKRKRMELEPEIRIPGLECNRALPENVPFVNNMVIEEPEYEIFFTDEFGDQTFQRWSDIDKVGMEALFLYLVAASMVQSPENARFNMKLKKLIAKHPEQDKLKSS
ncbi:hypothetical protein Tco_0888695 [Tanacetum coccineum]